jgi:hypothetical protein
MEIKGLTEQRSLLATLSPGKRTRLRRLLFEFGPGNGTLLFLPIDQGIEHGPPRLLPQPGLQGPRVSVPARGRGRIFRDRMIMLSSVRRIP